jgi:hypothetical protein
MNIVTYQAISFSDTSRMSNALDCIMENTIGHPMPEDIDDRRETRRVFMAGTPTRHNRSASPRSNDRNRRTPSPRPTRPLPRRAGPTIDALNFAPNRGRQNVHRTPSAGDIHGSGPNVRLERDHPRTHHPSCPASGWQRWNAARQGTPRFGPLSTTRPSGTAERDHDDEDSYYRRYRTTHHYSTTEEIVRRENSTVSHVRGIRPIQDDSRRHGTAMRRNGVLTSSSPRRHLSEHFDNFENIANGTRASTSTPRPPGQNRPRR